MQSTVTTITIETLQSADPRNYPTLRLVLRNPHPQDGHAESQGFFSRATQLVKDMFTKEAAALKLEEGATSEALSRNQKKIHKIFKEMKDQVDELEKQAMKELPTLNPEQQEDLLKFWSNVADFFSDLMGWLKSMFQEVIEKIRMGLHLKEDTVKMIFQQAAEFFKNMCSNVELQALGTGQRSKKEKLGVNKEQGNDRPKGEEEAKKESREEEDKAGPGGEEQIERESREVEGKEGPGEEEQEEKVSREIEGKEDEDGKKHKVKDGKKSKGQSFNEQVHKKFTNV